MCYKYKAEIQPVCQLMYLSDEVSAGIHWIAFIWMVTPLGFIHRLKSFSYLVQHNKQHHKKVLLSSIRLDDHTLGFHLQTQNLELPCTARMVVP